MTNFAMPTTDLSLGQHVVVCTGAPYANDFPEVFVIAGIDWHAARPRPVAADQINVTILPTTNLEEGGTDGFVPEDLRLATEDEISANRRLF